MGIRQTFLILGLTAAAFAQDLASRADDFVAAYVRQNKFSGSVLAAKDGKILFEKAYGQANRDWIIPNSTSTRFRIGSLTKPITATAILKLEEQGKIKTSDLACTYLPACPEAWKPITIQHLLNHTSGITSFTELPTYNRLKRLPSRYHEQVKAVWDLPLNFTPGEQFDYSNTGYVILGRIIEKAAGQPWEAFLEAQIFAPAGMAATRADAIQAVIPNRASGYYVGASVPQPAEFIDPAIPGAAGALLSTTGDLFRFHAALLGGKLLNEASLKKLLTPDKNNYAYGWIVQHIGPRTFHAHSGGIDGFSSQILYIPEDKLFVVVLSNFQDAETGPVRDGLLALLSGSSPELPKFRSSIELDSATLDEYVGTYQFSPVFSIAITREGNQLITQATGQRKIPVFAEAKDFLFPKVMPATLQIVREDGKVTGMILKQGGREMRATKLKN